MVDYNRIHFVWDSALSPKNGANIVRRGDHRSPENCIHFIRDGTTTSFFSVTPSLRATSPQGEAFKAPFEGSCCETTEGWRTTI